MKEVVVTGSYTAAYSVPVKLEAGARVKIGKTEDEWPGWLWCIDEADKSCWIHEDFLLRNEDGTADLRQDYDSTELTVVAGERLAVEYELGGWLRARTDKGLIGWVPAGNTDWNE